MSPDQEANRVSVVIATLNSARYLDECLGALRDQDYPRDLVEIVIADGGSTDDTLEIAARHGAERIVENRLRTGEAGKAAGVKVAGGDILVFVDSDNIVIGRDWLARMLAPFHDPEVIATEVARWDYRRDDHYINRWHALTGVADPLTLYVGNYCRESLVTGAWTGFPYRAERRDGWEKVTLDPDAVPVLGANGFAIRRRAFDEVPVGDYLFDLDHVYDLVQRGHHVFGRVDASVHHYFCDSLDAFRRKTRRRGDDFLYYSSQGKRSYPWAKRQRRAIPAFIASTVSVVPVFLDSLRGYRRRPDAAWAFHVAACWITLVVYAFSAIRGTLRPRELDRRDWRQ